MTRKNLYEWFCSGDITGEESYDLGKMGIGDCDRHTLQNLKQMLRCGDWVQSSWEIEYSLGDRIKKIVFFTPNFNDSKPDASNYSCAIVTDGNDDIWVIIYRPSYVSDIKDDVMIKRVTGEVAEGIVAEKSSTFASQTESELNGDCPISGVVPPVETSLSDYIGEPYICSKSLSYGARSNPDKYVLPLDIVKRPINSSFDHYAVYIGNEWVVELPGLESVKFITWKNFWDGGSSSGFFSSSNSGSGGIKEVYHPKIPFKRKHDIIRHIAKEISHGYGSCSYHNNTI